MIELAVRRVKLSNLPSKATLKNIVSLVWGGNVQEIVYKDGQSWAEVLFVNPEDCKRYYDSTPNGIEFPGSKGRHVEVEACEPESARGNVKDMVEKVMTRCVRVVDVEPKWTKAALETLAAGNGTKRPVESVVTGLDNKGVSLALLCWMELRVAASFRCPWPLTNGEYSAALSNSALERLPMPSFSSPISTVARTGSCILLASVRTHVKPTVASTTNRWHRRLPRRGSLMHLSIFFSGSEVDWMNS